MEPNILVIEDDDIVARTIERSLRGHEFRVTLANSGVDGLKTARRRRPDLVILDVIMPGMDGFQVCREMRSDPLLVEVPILFLTAKVKDQDKIDGFKAGADDYLCKPFNIDELVLRLRAILRRAQSQPGSDSNLERSPEHLPVRAGRKSLLRSKGSLAARQGGRHSITIGAYTLDTRTFELTTPGHGKVRLTPVQYDLLQHLMRHAGEVFSPSRLLDEVWDYPSDTGSPDLVRVHIKNLRERIEDDPRMPTFIRTVPGYGYTIDPTEN